MENKENKANAFAEEEYVLGFTGEETDALLKHTEDLKNQTTAEDGDTVQVYDVNGIPHKVKKTELFSKAGIDLPSLSEIGGFVAYDKTGKALGLMSKEQAAEVLGGLLPLASPEKNGLFPSSGFQNRGRTDINTNANMLTNSGVYAVYCYGQNYTSKNYPFELGHIMVYKDNVGGSVSQLAVSTTGDSYTRMRWGAEEWSSWKKLS